MTHDHVPGPLVIGGVGGSGTRVVADIVRRGGYHIGDDLNIELDNLWFTLLCRRPRWYARQHARPGRGVRRNLRILEAAMHGRLRPTPPVLSALAGAGLDLARDFNARWVRSRVRSMLGAQGPPSGSVGWGWKEPNSHVLLDELAGVWPTLRFVLVVRNGLDLAFSGNQQQLHRWGRFYRVPQAGPEPDRSVRYWLAANRRAIDVGRARLGERFRAMSFEGLCGDPERGARALLDFAGCPAAGAEAGAELVRPPSTLGRHREHPHPFEPGLAEAVEELMAEVGP